MKKLAFTALFLLIATGLMASNTGFKLNYPVTITAGTLQNFGISLPYFYFPGGVGTQATAESVCTDADENLASVNRYLADLDQIQTWNCPYEFGTDFDIESGRGYRIIPANDFTFNIVGSHDDEFRPAGNSTIDLLCDAGTLCNNWVSYPYHGMYDTVAPLCDEMETQTPNVAIISQYLDGLDQIQSYNCIYDFGQDFSLTPGLGLIFVMQGAAGVQFETY